MAENYDIIGRKLKALDPDRFAELNDPPILSDISLVPQILEDISQTTFKSCFSKESLTIAIILRLYEPDVLKGWKRAMKKNGLRKILSCYFICGPANISYYIPKVRNYYMIYHSFKDEVDYISNQLAKQYGQGKSEE